MQYTTFYSFPSTTTPPSTPAPLPIKNILVYIGLPSNPQFLGPQSQDALAERIVRCKGPSGENREYLFMLRDALRDLHMGEGGREEDGSGGDGGGARVVGDPHVEDLAERVERLVEMEREEGGKGDGDGDGKVVERARSGGVVETS